MTKNFKKLKSLHELPAPLILYNCWDVASARAIQQGGAPVIATSSYAIAESLGAVDGEHLTFDEMFLVISRIAKNVSLPLTVDIETGYARNLEELAQNLERLLVIGVCGVNLEDQLIGVTNPGLAVLRGNVIKSRQSKKRRRKLARKFLSMRVQMSFSKGGMRRLTWWKKRLAERMPIKKPARMLFSFQGCYRRI